MHAVHRPPARPPEAPALDQVDGLGVGEDLFLGAVRLVGVREARQRGVKRQGDAEPGDLRTGGGGRARPARPPQSDRLPGAAPSQSALWVAATGRPLASPQPPAPPHLDGELEEAVEQRGADERGPGAAVQAQTLGVGHSGVHLHSGAGVDDRSLGGPCQAGPRCHHCTRPRALAPHPPSRCLACSTGRRGCGSR